MPEKEATARIKINRRLEAAGWRFFPEGGKPANIRLEPSIAVTSSDLDALGNDFEKAVKGFVDFLLLDARGFPLIVLEAKAENKNPLVGKEQARKYARSQNCRFVIFTTPMFSTRDFKTVPPKFRTLVPEYVKDYVSLNQFAA